MSIASLKRYMVTGTALLALGIGVPAFGQSPEVKAGARAAANQGLEAFKAGDYEGAIERFGRANELIRAPTHTLYLARSHAKLGRLVQARELYLEIDRENLAEDSPDAFLVAQAEARQELESLEARLPRVTVQVSGPGADDAEVMMDDKPLPAALIGIEHPVDPGKHRFRASSGETKARPVSITIQEGEKKTISLELRELATTEPLPDEPPPPKPKEQPSDDGGSVHPLTVAGYTALGVGVVGLAAGGYFSVQKGDRESEADSLFSTCNPRVCTDDERRRIDHIDEDASAAGRNALIGFIVGGVGIVGGVTMLVLAPSSDESGEVATTVQPWVGIGSAGVSGRF